MMTDEVSATAHEVPWRSLPRRSVHRTSPPTNAAVRRATAAMTADRDGRAVLVDTVILAALSLALKDPAGLRAEVERIERATFKAE